MILIWLVLDGAAYYEIAVATQRSISVIAKENEAERERRHRAQKFVFC